MMTTYSRSRVALHIAALPFLFVAHVATEAYHAAREAAGDVRVDFLPAVRYVVHGNPDATVASVVANKTVAAGAAVHSFFANQVATRLAALLVLIIMPALLAYVAIRVLIEEDVFGDAAGAFVALVRSIVTGEDFRDL